jgi:hypothetical protein
MNDQPYLVPLVSANADELDLRDLLMRQFERGVVTRLERATNAARRKNTFVDLREAHEAYRVFRQELERWAVEIFGTMDEFDYPTRICVSREDVAEHIGADRARRLDESQMDEVAEKVGDGLRDLFDVTLGAVLEDVKIEEEDEAIANLHQSLISNTRLETEQA